MRDLRLTNSDENGIVLETLEGEKFLLQVDDSVKAAVRASAPKAGPETTLSPRDIQDRVRSGQGIDEIIAESGADPHFVETFALPVLDELEHMVASARSVRLTIPGDRFSDDSQIEFGELVDRRLLDNGASSISWSSKRGESAFWLVSVAFELGGNFGTASWLFDPRKVELSPEDETASALSVLDGNPGPLPKSRFATEPPAAFRKQASATKKESTKVAPVIDIATARDTSADTQASDAIDSTPSEYEDSPVVETKTTESVQVVSESSTADVGAGTDTTPMNVTTLHFKTDTVVTETIEVIEAPVESLEAEVGSADIEEISSDLSSEVDERADNSEDADLPEADVYSDLTEAEESPDEEPTTATGSIGLPKKGRASMPSWDEIVFGTKTDD